ncbi:MAG: biotin--[acetyl-CoA-carboxylase] ligase [Thermoleophilaceae bacterium]
MSRRVGYPRVHHRLTDSTNARARELAIAGAPDGTIVTATEQSAGRGRQGRSWTAPPARSLLLSLIVTGLGRGDALLPLAVPVAVAEACDEFAGRRCGIKWPNDVWIADRKVAGILLEGRPQEGWAVIGIGLNVGTTEQELPPELRDSATSLALASGVKPKVELVLQAVLAYLQLRLGDRPARILDAWRERDILRGREVRWNGGNGTAAGLDESGGLIVDTDAGRVVLDAGEVHLFR